MARFAVAGLINIETTLRIDEFPLRYSPVRFPFNGVNCTVSGVGYNLSKALVMLGHEVDFMALIGRDLKATMVRAALDYDRIPREYVLAQLEDTPQSVILYDGDGKRAINVDLKDIQEQTYPAGTTEALLAACDVALLCNINFARPFLRRARELGKPLATDVHTISDLDDPYNRDYMAAADILFMSDEKLPCSPRNGRSLCSTNFRMWRLSGSAWANTGRFWRCGAMITSPRFRRWRRGPSSAPSAQAMRCLSPSCTAMCRTRTHMRPCAKPCFSPRTRSAWRAQQMVF